MKESRNNLSPSSLVQNLKNLQLIKWWNNYKRSKIGVAGLIIFVIIILAAILAPYLGTVDPSIKTSAFYNAPSWSHLLGTNSQGQDVFSELLYSSRVSIMIGVAVALVVVTIGTIVGLTAGYYGGLADEILIRTCDILLVIPGLPLLIVLAAYMGPGIGNMIFVLSVLGWTGTARKVRAQTLAAKELGFVEAAKSTGASGRHIIINHILPNVAGIVIADFILAITFAIMAESGLSFLGLGDPLHKSWGMMLFFAQHEGAFSIGAWWYWLFPGLAIALISCACSFMGNTINDRFVLRLGRVNMKSRRRLYDVAHGTGPKSLFKSGNTKIKPEAR
jgi:ABC-type dipeptide/oligopeptide/nickel transport system permease subunit